MEVLVRGSEGKGDGGGGGGGRVSVVRRGKSGRAGGDMLVE